MFECGAERNKDLAGPVGRRDPDIRVAPGLAAKPVDQKNGAVVVVPDLMPRSRSQLQSHHNSIKQHHLL